MNRDQLADWLHCLHGGMYDWVIDEIKKELAKPEQEFYPDWDMLKPFYERIKELEEQLAKPEQEPVRWFQQFGDAPTRKDWVGLTDDEIFKDDAIMAANSGYGANFETLRELTKAIEAKLKEKNT
jgi:hypothetical protein